MNTYISQQPGKSLTLQEIFVVYRELCDSDAAITIGRLCVDLKTTFPELKSVNAKSAGATKPLWGYYWQTPVIAEVARTMMRKWIGSNVISNAQIIEPFPNLRALKACRNESDTALAEVMTLRDFNHIILEIFPHSDGYNGLELRSPAHGPTVTNIVKAHIPDRRERVGGRDDDTVHETGEIRSSRLSINLVLRHARQHFDQGLRRPLLVEAIHHVFPGLSIEESASHLTGVVDRTALEEARLVLEQGGLYKWLRDHVMLRQDSALSLASLSTDYAISSGNHKAPSNLAMEVALGRTFSELDKPIVSKGKLFGIKLITPEDHNGDLDPAWVKCLRDWVGANILPQADSRINLLEVASVYQSTYPDGGVSSVMLRSALRDAFPQHTVGRSSVYVRGFKPDHSPGSQWTRQMPLFKIMQEQRRRWICANLAYDSGFALDILQVFDLYEASTDGQRVAMASFRSIVKASFPDVHISSSQYIRGLKHNSKTPSGANWKLASHNAFVAEFDKSSQAETAARTRHPRLKLEDDHDDNDNGHPAALAPDTRYRSVERQVPQIESVQHSTAPIINQTPIAAVANGTGSESALQHTSTDLLITPPAKIADSVVAPDHDSADDMWKSTAPVHIGAQWFRQCIEYAIGGQLDVEVVHKAHTIACLRSQKQPYTRPMLSRALARIFPEVQVMQETSHVIGLKFTSMELLPAEGQDTITMPRNDDHESALTSLDRTKRNIKAEPSSSLEHDNEVDLPATMSVTADSPGVAGDTAMSDVAAAQPVTKAPANSEVMKVAVGHLILDSPDHLMYHHHLDTVIAACPSLSSNIRSLDGLIDLVQAQAKEFGVTRDLSQLNKMLRGIWLQRHVSHLAKEVQSSEAFVQVAASILQSGTRHHGSGFVEQSPINARAVDQQDTVLVCYDLKFTKGGKLMRVDFTVLAGSAGGKLASAVTNAGGVGFIGAGYEVKNISAQLESAATLVTRQSNGLLPLGIGLLNFLSDADETLALLAQHKPAIVWFFAAKQLADYAVWTQKARAALHPETQIWIQIGSVAGALQIARECRPDVLVLQGIDAGGHGFEKGAGIISLVPEVADALDAAGMGEIPLVAAGGIVESRGAAAAFALGAQGVVMGTRFLAATEIDIHPGHRKAVLATSDGGRNTTRAKLFDNLKGPSVWPEDYDGRSVVMESFSEHEAGVDIEEIRKRVKEALKAPDAGFGVDGKGRVAMWAGTGVGLVKREQSASEIVEETRAGVVSILGRFKARM
nr:nitronate monooxygenase [Quercus suber]